MLRNLVAATVLVVATLAATSAMAHDPHRGGCYPSYRSYPSYHHHHHHHQRSHFHYRDPHQWDMYRNYLRHHSKYYRSYSPYRYAPSHHGIGIHGRHFSLHFGF